MKIVDLRSDTVTRPSAGMKQAMFEAELGDDVFGDDPTVKALESKAAELFGKEAALFVPSGTMGNEIALNVLGRPGEEVLLEAGSHIFNYEGGGPAALSGLVVHPLKGERGRLTAAQIEAHVHSSDVHEAPTRIVALENTHNSAGGTVWPLDEIKRIKQVAVIHQLKMHLDGARLWNASIASGIPLADWAAPFDTVMSCLSKGLGCPVGSVLAGSRETIVKARRVRKMFGGGMRQAGVLAAAGLYALEHNFSRLAEDHVNARYLAENLANLRGIHIDLDTVQTNIVIADVKESGKPVMEVVSQLKMEGIWVVPFGPTHFRAVCHLDVSRADVELALGGAQRLFEPVRVPAATAVPESAVERPMNADAGRRFKAGLNDLITSYCDGRPENEYYLSLKSGDVLLVTAETPDSEREKIFAAHDELVLLPKKISRQGYQDLIDFIEILPASQLKESLKQAVEGKGAFRRFKDVLLSYPDERKRWFDFSTERDEKRIREWLGDNGLFLDG